MYEDLENSLHKANTNMEVLKKTNDTLEHDLYETKVHVLTWYISCKITSTSLHTYICLHSVSTEQHFTSYNMRKSGKCLQYKEEWMIPTVKKKSEYSLLLNLTFGQKLVFESSL